MPLMLHGPTLSFNSSSTETYKSKTIESCFQTNRVLGSNDFGSVQFNVGHVDPKTGIYTGDFTPIALSGVVRKRGEADMAVNELVGKMGNKWPLAQ